jgi:hypothetical protein
MLGDLAEVYHERFGRSIKIIAEITMKSVENYYRHLLMRLISSCDNERLTTCILAARRQAGDINNVAHGVGGEA